MTNKIKGQPIYSPMELLVIVENRRYGTKLDESQTANKIELAVSPLGVRAKSINEGKQWLQWDTENFMRNYGF